MIITEEDKIRVISIANYLKNKNQYYSDGNVKYWYKEAAIIFYISNGLSPDTSREMAKLMVKELEENAGVVNI